MDEYPKWLYHATEHSIIVASREEQDALGDEWAETPAEFDDSEDGVAVTAPKRGRPKKVQ